MMRRLILYALLLLPLTVLAQKEAVCPAGQQPAAAPVLWHVPTAMTAQDWVCGPGGCDRTPAPPFRFVKEETTGTNAKVVVKDARDRTWSVKFGAEVIPECFAPRFLMALGYTAEYSYFVGSGKIEGLRKLQRAGRVVHKDGAFAKGRFELRGQKDLVFMDGRTWSWTDNPFRGSHELAGLKIIMMLLSNWDAKDARDGPAESNNVMFCRPGAAPAELVYAVSDWGASLGRWGGVFRRDQSDCAGFTSDTPHFMKGVRENELELGFAGKHVEDVKTGISVEDVRWLLPYLQRITPEQLRAGLKASGATACQAECWSQSIESRIQQLASASSRHF